MVKNMLVQHTEKTGYGLAGVVILVQAMAGMTV
jgi:hypothetical protein